MNVKQFIKILLLAIFVCLAAGVGLFLYNANHAYNIRDGFSSVPLQFDPDDSSSTITWHGSQVTVHGGFVKGVQSGGFNGDSLVIRALSPLPSIEIKNGDQLYARTMSITLENVNPDFYAKQIDPSLSPSRTAVNTLEFTLDANPNAEINIVPATPSVADSGRYIVMGDNRDGYGTFDAIIAQANALNPIFVINSGDLVFSGKPNQYRLFDQSAANVAATLCLTLGNHDIRQNGRAIYTKLYGPAYYSFDFGDNHFVFLDSSPGWTQKQAISDEQYAWLERDLQKAQGKNIYVVTHIPPTDPRAGVTPNELPAYMDQLKNDQGAIENLLDRYEANENIDHGFQDRQEAARFENLMTEYHVNTVYLSHIHSYFDFTKNNVRYIISGGAGAELLTENSYYHFLIAKLGDPTITIVELPSPANTLVARYSATAALFAKAMYRENRMAATFFLIGVGLFVLLLLTLIVLRLRRSKLWILVRDTGKSAGKRFKELYPKKKRG